MLKHFSLNCLLEYINKEFIVCRFNNFMAWVYNFKVERKHEKRNITDHPRNRREVS
jgi:hypothetical protein